jgi:hypothetical protein
MAGDLKQEEIDQILETLSAGAPDFEAMEILSSSAAAKDAVQKARTVRACIARLNFSLAARAGPGEIREARQGLHVAAFGLWCANRGMQKSDYYAAVRRGLKKRGLRYVGSNPPGFKLVRAF